MSPFVINLFLAFGWAGIWGEVSGPILAAGFVLGYAALWMARPLVGGTGYHGRALRVVSFTVFYLYEVVASGLRVAWQVLSPGMAIRPAIIAVPLDARTDAEITAFANLVSLTPGSLSLDLSPDRRTLYVHVMDVGPGGPDALRADLKLRFERRILRLMR